MTTVKLTADPAATLDVDALVVGLARAGRGGPTVVAPDAGLTTALRRRLEAAFDAVGATGTPGEVVRVPGSGLTTAPLVVGVGLGDAAGRRPAWDLEMLRRAAGAATRSLEGSRRVAVALPADTPERVEAVAQGAGMGAYAFTAFRGTGSPSPRLPVRSVLLVVPDPRDREARARVRHAGIVASAVALARDLVNTPPSALPPAALAAAAREAVRGLPVDVQVLDDRALKRDGYGGILAVGQGSANAPRLIRLAYRHADPVAHLALVGKGVTFDSGGISLKPPKGMDVMKSDLGGAAAVIAAVAAIARLGLPLDVTGYAPAVENMPSGTAQRPGDVITIYGGRTVEVLNTDAEGRLILADALVRAQEDDPDLVVDIATLTGAQQVALGNRTSGIMGNDDDARDGVWESSERAGESMWPMPLPEELRASLDSPVADIANIGERMGGMMTAGVFLSEFVAPDVAWVHIDIAGPAFNEGAAYGYTPKGGTGVGARTLIQVAEDLAAGEL